MNKPNTVTRIILALALTANTCGFYQSRAFAAPYNTPGGMPDYIGGIYPNYANSPIIRKFVDSLPGLGFANKNNNGQYIPIAIPDTTAYPNSDYYEIGVKDHSEIMHSDLPPTKIRGYYQKNTTDPNVSAAHYLGPLIIAHQGRPTRIKFLNELGTGSSGNLFIPVDTTMMGAGMGPLGMDASPMEYTQNRADLHLHGGDTPWISDGTPHQWVTPPGEVTPYKKGVSFQNVPDMIGPGKSIPNPSDDDGMGTYYYPNGLSGRLMFYHDHSYGITRLNVYSGEAAGYLLVDTTEAGLITNGILPNQGNPATNYVYRYGIPLVIQDKTFVDANNIPAQDPTWNAGTTAPIPNSGDLWYPHVYMPNQNPNDPSGANAMGRWDYGPWFWPPVTAAAGLVHGPVTDPVTGQQVPGTPDVSSTMEAFMDTPVINGCAYPYLNVTQDAYRFRILNASNDRTLNIQLYFADTGGGGQGALGTATVVGGVVTAITVTAGGTGYTTKPYVNIADLNGKGALATATIAGGAVTGVTVTAGGSGYGPNPSVTFSSGGPGGSGANATATIAGGAVTTINIADGGSNYTSAPGVQIIGGGGTGAYASATVSNGVVTGITVLTGGTGYTSIPSIVIGGDTEVKMVMADPNVGLPVTWPTDGRAGGVPDPTKAGPKIIQIGTEGGFLPAPVIIENTPVNYVYDRRNIVVLDVDRYSLRLMPAERADVIIDFSNVPAGSKIIMYNDWPAPSPAFDPRSDYYTGNPDLTYATGNGSGGAPTTLPGYGPNTRTMMQFRVAAGSGTAFNLAGLQTAWPAAYSATHPTPIVPNGTYSAIQDTSLTFPTSQSLGSITLNTGGSGYSAPTTVTLSGGGGTEAEATATVVGGVITAINVTNKGMGYTSAPTVAIAGTGTGATATAVVDATTQTISGITVTAGGTGYSTGPIITFTGGGGGTGASAIATVTNGSITAITLRNGGSGYTIAPTVNITGGTTNATATANLGLAMYPKAIQELFELDYGRMNATMGVEVPLTNFNTQTTIPYGYIDPPTEILEPGKPQVWKITHNGVDTHAVHFHLFNVQLVNRVGWDGQIKPPDPDELGWKETLRMNPLEDCIVALKPITPSVPFNVPESVRPLDPTMPLGSTMGFSGIDPNNNPNPVVNKVNNFGWEYVWHCHLLDHEEMDMMRAMVFEAPAFPGKPGAVTATPGNARATVSFVYPLNNLSSPITNYTVTSSPGGRTASGTSSPLTVTNLTNGTSYTFTVTATSALGTGSASVPSDPVIPGNPPGIPTNVTATPGNAQATVSFNAPAIIGDGPITGYTVTSSPGNITTTGTISPVTITGLTNGTTYTFTVTATNAFGTGQSSSPSNAVTPNVPGVPGAPTGIIAYPGTQRAYISFTAPTSNGGNTITSYTATSNPGGRTGTGTSSPLTVTGLNNGTTYTFTVTATNALGTGPASTPSNGVRPQPQTTPGPPLSVTATAGNTQAIISFRPAQSNGSPIIRYTVTSNPGGRTAIGTTTPITVTGLTNGATYTFTMTATNARGTGPASTPSNSITLPSGPGTPTGVTATAGNAQAVVAFTPPASNGGSPITSYTTTSNPGGKTATGPMSPLTVTGLTNGTAYTFTVTATNARGTSPASTPSNSVTPALLPGTPTIGTATAGNTQAVLAFTPPASNGGSPITSYIVTSSPGGTTATGTASPITITGLTNGVAYTFTVRATTAIGTGPASNPSNSVTPATVPLAPTGVTATAGNSQANVAFTLPALNGGSPITGYTVISTPSTITATGTTSPITVTGLTNGTPYTFIVKATNAIGISTASAPSNAIVPAALPGIPTNVTAVGGNAQATVSFSPAPANGNAITGYTVTSSPGNITATGPTSPINVTGLTNGTTYTFTVRATNALGTGLASAPSNNATPATVPGSPTGLTAVGGNLQATVSFTAPVSNGGSPILLYMVTSSPGGISAMGTSSPITVTGLTNGVAYSFTATAINAIGNSPASVASNSVTPTPTVPGAPIAATAVAGNLQATIGFTAPMDGGSPITNYTVTSSPGGFTASGAVSPLTVTGLTNGTAYTFTVTATNSYGTGPASAPSNSVTPAASGAPSAPTGISAVAGNALATVSFTPPASNGGSPIIFYTVTSSLGAITATGPTSPITVTGLTNGTAYTFTVTAFNAFGTGAVSTPSNSVTPNIIPGAPTIGTATAGNTTATVAFSPPVSNGGTPITSYTVISSPGAITATGPANPITITGLSNGTAYTFTVTATNIAGTSTPSAPSNSVTPAGLPTAPTTVSAAPGNAQAIVTFSGASANGSPITSYTVTSNPGGLTASGATSPLTITGLTNGTTYAFTVTATNAAGTSTPSAPSNSVTPNITPGAPTIGTATAGDTTASVSFTPPAPNGGSPITSYTATSSPGGLTASGAASPLTVTGLTNGTTYSFTVTATNTAGTSTPSAPSNSVTPAGLPTPPATITAAPGNTQATVTFSGAGANGSPITSYTVTSSPGGSTASGATSPLTVTGLTNGTAYTFTVTATNAVGTSSSSAPSNSVTPATVPGAPTIGTATAGNTTANVSFTPPASNGGNTITGYTVTSNPGNITAAGTAIPISVTGLTNGTAYTFTVTATNGIGTGPASNPTNSVTPAGLPTAPTTVTATPGNTQATVTFSGASANGSPITSYTVTSSPGGFTASGAASPLTVTGLTNGTAYSFTVTATNGVGTSPASAPSNSVTPGPPPAPINFTGSAVPAGPSTATVTLSWQETAPAAGFTLQRALDSNFTVGLTSFSLPGNTNSYVDGNRPRMRTIYYRILATNNAGSSAWTNTAVTTP